MKNALSEAVSCLDLRGPDANGTYLADNGNSGFGHTRLAIIDLSEAGAQPMYDEEKEYAIIFNGEIFNFKNIREELKAAGFHFKSDSDTEVVLKSYKYWGKDCLHKFNGFFALAIHDIKKDNWFIARDRIGIKPLYIYEDEEKLIFGSEMKALMKFPIDKEIDFITLWQYLQLNYIPGPATIFKKVRKLLPGFSLFIQEGSVQEEQWYTIPYDEGHIKKGGSYEDAQQRLRTLLNASVEKRLIADVPLGAFLSGGIDSSVIVALASQHTKKLNTFSIGYKDNKFFDETRYAELVANKYRTNHTAFYLTNDDLHESLFKTLDYIDEPFADSSALVVNILSRKTRQHVTVALSGDGGDELFAGYNKHFGEYRVRQGGLAANAVAALYPLWNALPKSRNGKIGNKIRQLHRFAEGMRLSPQDRYWRWCGFIKKEEALRLLHPSIAKKLSIQDDQYEQRKESFTRHIKKGGSINEVLYADCKLVLPNDMLTKVDLMSMSNSLEVRVPFLDHEVVEFAFSLPADYKINQQLKKRIVQDAFRDMLPPELYNRPKQGFEVPLLQWFRTDLRDLIENDLLAEDFIREQKIFDPLMIRALKKKLYSNNPEDVHAQIYGLIVFQYWWKKYMV